MSARKRRYTFSKVLSWCLLVSLSYRAFGAKMSARQRRYIEGLNFQKREDLGFRI